MDRMFLVDSPNRLPFVLNEYFAKKHYRFARCKTISYGIDDDSIVQLDSHNCISIYKAVVCNNTFGEDTARFPMTYDVALSTLTNT